MSRLFAIGRPATLRRLAGAAVCAFVCAPAAGDSPKVDFNERVRPLFVQHCLACHGGVKQAGGLSFVSRELAMAEGDSGIAVIEPGDHAASYLYDRVSDPDDAYRMPPREHGRRLSDAELAALRAWIDQGARWDDPWAFQPPRDARPEPTERRWGRAPLDAFVLARLESEGLAPSPEADRRQWLRRVTFDLTGLPPTEDERVAFLSDSAPDAHERVVERLLASPHFGERWASVWLDLARYADTMGFERDPPRTIWPWRDWVVRALNADTPYDEFLLKQFAGDLLPGATLGDRLATAMHRNSLTNTEGGTDDEEFRWMAVVDRVDSTWAGLLGVTMGCARCHDHPYDPIEQADYYRFAALLNTTRDADLVEDLPTLDVPKDPDRYAEMQRVHDALREVRRHIHAIGVEACQPEDRWTPLAIESAESTGETRLVVRTGEGGPEVLAEGTVSDRSRYTVVARAPTERVTALRIDASPVDPVKAIGFPEYGFVLSRVRAFVERGGADSEADNEEVFLVEVLADETDGFFRPIDTLRDNAGGWGPYTRMRRPRWVTFLPDRPIELGPDDRLRIDLKHGKATDGQGPLVMRRFTVSVSDDERFARLATDARLQRLREREAELIAARDAIPTAATPILVEQPDTLKRRTFLFERGAWTSPQEEVRGGIPATIPGSASDRLELGRWLGSDENPLTARVMVNRVWNELFGAGLVETLDDFGSTGADPSHPELLDHLAVRFRDDFGWSLKALLRELVLSSTYRQDARADHELAAHDPSNRLLARGPRNRLRAEMVRDQALVLSGRLNPKIGGPPVMPYQPDGVWRTVYNDREWETADGPARFRRALYTYWKRTAAYPSLVAFDAPSREQCTVARPTTNTPLQALVTLNDPAYLELAEGLADRMLARREESPAERIAWAAAEATGRPLPDESLTELVRLYDETVPDSDPRFAATIVANVLLNLDATLTK